MLFFKQFSFGLSAFLLMGMTPSHGANYLPAGIAKWEAAALRLTGESEGVRLQSIQILRKIPELEKLLRKELNGKRKYLALDVISALKLQALLPDLIQLSQEDESGFFYLAINSLVNKSNTNEIAQIYQDRLLRSQAPATWKVVLLDSLIRMRFHLKPEALEKLLLKDPSPDVRSAALYFLRGKLVTYGDAEYFPVLRKALEKPDTSTRQNLQALYLLSELPIGVFKALRGVKTHCPKVPPQELKTVCLRLDQAGKL